MPKYATKTAEQRLQVALERTGIGYVAHHNRLPADLLQAIDHHGKLRGPAAIERRLSNLSSLGNPVQRHRAVAAFRPFVEQRLGERGRNGRPHDGPAPRSGRRGGTRFVLDGTLAHHSIAVYTTNLQYETISSLTKIRGLKLLLG